MGIQPKQRFDARGYLQPSSSAGCELRLNVYGFNVGGPVTLGKLYNRDRKKTFFFYNMEWRRLIQGSITNTACTGSGTYGGNFSADARLSRFRQRLR